jgi:hypothetical protein
MAECVRLVAEHAGDVGDPQDTRWKLVFDGILQGRQLVSQLCFGYSIDVDDNDQVDKWPFLLEPNKKGNSARLDFGPEGDPRFEAINIFQKEIEIGALFTRGADDDTATYRITEIKPLG